MNDSIGIQHTSACQFCRAAIALAVFAIGPIHPAQAQELLTNGNFETGTLAGWSAADQPNAADSAAADHFYVSTPGSDTPAIDGITFATALNGAGGKYYAVSASDYPGAHALLQDFVVPTDALSLKLSFQMFVNDQSGIGPIVDPAGLDYTTGGAYNDNQHARVDILRAGASDLSTDAADVLDTLYLNVDPFTYDANGNPIPNPYLDYSADLSALLAPGGTYRLRFAEVDNLSAINLGVDNVSLFASTVGVPEPGAAVWLVGCLGGAGFVALRRKR